MADIKRSQRFPRLHQSFTIIPHLLAYFCPGLIDKGCGEFKYQANARVVAIFLMT